MAVKGSPSGFLLFCLLVLNCKGGEGDQVDNNTLGRIIQFFENNYKKFEQSGAARQYAVAINVPKNQCQEFVPDNNNFLTEEDAKNVKNIIYNEKVALYEGTQLIAAGTLNKGKYNRHSEAILLNPSTSSNVSPMENLLNKLKDGCEIFYTLNSPCVQTCIDSTGKYSILKALENWKNGSKNDSVKAFVFKDIWKFDVEKNLTEKFKEVIKYVPLYRCVSAETCYDCGSEDNINERCISDS